MLAHGPNMHLPLCRVYEGCELVQKVLLGMLASDVELEQNMGTAHDQGSEHWSVVLCSLQCQFGLYCRRIKYEAAEPLHLRMLVATRQVPARDAAATALYSVVSSAVRNLDVNLDSLNLLCTESTRSMMHSISTLCWSSWCHYQGAEAVARHRPDMVRRRADVLRTSGGL